jgi:hypothetical protein
MKYVISNVLHLFGSQTTPIYKLLKINEQILQKIIMKIKLYERLKTNELTNSIIIALETMPME